MGLNIFDEHSLAVALAKGASATWDCLVSFADRLVPYGPLITPSVAILAGGIALYSIHVTRSIARKRATIDFFLKTEADSSIVKLFQQFDEHVSVANAMVQKGNLLPQITAREEYKTVHACLNIHELIAVGIENDVFDEKVAYNYWSGVLVGHCDKARPIIDFSRVEPDDRSAYISMLKLNGEWKKKIDKWMRQQPTYDRPPLVVPGPVTPDQIPGIPADPGNQQSKTP